VFTEKVIWLFSGNGSQKSDVRKQNLPAEAASAQAGTEIRKAN